MAVKYAKKVNLSVNVAEVIRVQAQSNYCTIFFADGSKLVVSKILAFFEQQFGQAFWRIHRSHLINSHYVRRVKINNSKSSIVLHNGDVLPIARRKKQAMINLTDLG